MDSNIWKYYFLRIFSKRIIAPVFVIYLLLNGLDPIQIGTILSLGKIIGLVFEFPSGFVSDKIGHKHALAISFLLRGMSMFFYAYGDSFFWFLGGAALYAAGLSFWTGTSNAFLYESLKNVGREEEYEKFQGRSTAISQPINGLLLIAIPFLYVLNTASVFYLNFVFYMIAVLISLALKQPKFTESVSDKEGFAKLFEDLGRIWRYLFRQRMFGAMTILYSFTNAVQNAFDEFMQLYFNFIGLPQKLFGLAYFCHRTLLGAGGWFADKARKRLDEFTAALSMTGMLALFAVLASAARHWTGFFIFPARSFFEGLYEPVQIGLINRQIKVGDRVALLSIGNLISGLMEAAMVFMLGVLFETVGVPQTFLISSIFVAAVMGGLSLWIWRLKVRHPAA
jgi:MFS family permease